LFADDIKTYRIANSIADAVEFQHLINLIDEWCSLWQLVVNINESFILHLGISNENYLYNLSWITLPSPSIVSDLGVAIDKSLSFSSHISTITGKARSRCGVFFKNLLSRDKRTMLLFVYHLCLAAPWIQLSSLVHVSSADINKLEDVQRFLLTAYEVAPSSRTTKVCPSCHSTASSIDALFPIFPHYIPLSLAVLTHSSHHIFNLQFLS